MNSYMGVDIGTSGCKAVVFDKAGRQVALAYREYDLISLQPGQAELDCDEVLEKCFEVMAEAAGSLEPQSVRGLGISCQGEAFAPIDSGGGVLSNAMVSSDIRAEQYTQKWTRQFGPKKLYQITGHTAHPMFSLFKLLWLRDHHPAIWSQAVKFFCFEDMLQSRLGLDPAIGWSLAARTMLFDVRAQKWSKEILEAVGLRCDQLARPLPAGAVVGRIEAAIAEGLSLAPGAVVVAGGHDQPCGALGAGATRPGVAMYATGTVECITPAFEKAVFAENLQVNNLCTYHHAAPGLYATVAFNLTGGNILKWFRDEFGALEVAEAERTGVNVYQLLLEVAGDKPSNLLVLPYFTATGTPYFDPRASGAILGLRLTTTRGQIIRGLLEGVAMEMRLNLEILSAAGCEVNELRAIGGGAKSDRWTQLKADVLGRPITVLNITEAACLGVAMLARAADTGELVLDLAARWNKPVSQKQPDPKAAEHYRNRFEFYKQLYPALKDLSHVL